jgi:hypothetical protein
LPKSSVGGIARRFQIAAESIAHLILWLSGFFGSGRCSRIAPEPTTPSSASSIASSTRIPPKAMQRGPPLSTQAGVLDCKLAATALAPDQTGQQKISMRNRDFSFAHFNLSAVLARLGEVDEARAAVQAGLALNPSFTIRRLRDATNAGSDNPIFFARRDRSIEGMRLAGVPERLRLAVEALGNQWPSG